MLRESISFSISNLTKNIIFLYYNPKHAHAENVSEHKIFSVTPFLLGLSTHRCFKVILNETLINLN